MDEREQEILNSFKEDFKELKERGWVPSNRFHDTGIGKTCEDLLKIAENNSGSADYKNLIEIKSARELSEAMLTLFTKSPEPRGVNEKIKNAFGYPDEVFNHINILHTTLSAVNCNNCKGKFGFQLKIDEAKEKIFITVKNLETDTIDNSMAAYYSFNDLKKKIEEKCKYIAFIVTEHKKEKGKELFKFNKAFLLSGLTFIKFLEFVSDGSIKYDFRLGVYKSGKNKGKKHDHGSGFRVLKKDIDKIFDVDEIS